MKKQKGNKQRGRNKPPSHQGAVRNTPKRKSRLLVIGGVCFAAILGLFITKSFWHAVDGSGEGAQQVAKASVAGGKSSSQPAAKPSGTPAAGPASAGQQFTEENLERETITVLNHLVKDFPDSADPLGLMGDVYVELGKTVEAMKCWEKCIELQPHHAGSYMRMAHTAVERGEFARAVAIAHKALTIDPVMPGIHGQLGRALRGLAKPAESLAAFEKAVKIPARSAANQAVNYHLLGQAYQQLQQYEKAKQSNMTALQLDPTYTEACYGIVSASARLGHKDEAARYRKKFKEMKARDWQTLPDESEYVQHQKLLVKSRRLASKTHTNAGILYFDNNRRQMAEKHWMRAAELDPGNMECRQELANLYQQNGQNEKAFKIYEQLATLYRQHRRYEEALRICEQLRKLAPKNPRYHIGAATLLMQMNRTEEALTAVKQAIELEPDNASFKRMYDEIQKRR